MNESLQIILSALGNALLNSIWQSGMLWLLALLYTKVYPKASPALLSSVNFFAIVLSFLLFLGTFLISLIHPPAASNSFFTQLIHQLQTPTLLMYTAVLYLVLLTIPLFKFFIGLQNIYILKNKGIEKASQQFCAFLADACQNLDIKRKVKIFTSTIANAPLTIGLVKPVILLPFALMNQLSTTQVEAIILHELAHIKRNDYLQNFISQIIVSILYFNPFIHLLVQQQNLEREKSADAWVLKFSSDRHLYASTLLLLAQQCIREQTKMSVPISGNQSNLLHRIECIAGVGKRKHPTVKALFLLLPSVLLAFLLSFYGGPTESSITNVHTFSSNTIDEIRFVTNHENDSGKIATISNLYQLKNQTAKYNSNVRNFPPKTFDNDSSLKSDPDGTLEENTFPDLKPAFISETTVIIPSLSEVNEKNVQEVISTMQRIMAEANWQIIDLSLAETVTNDFRQAVKNAYIERIQKADWQKQADMLRLYYHNIDWITAQKKLEILTALIQLDATNNQGLQINEMPAPFENEISPNKVSIHNIDTVSSYEINKQDSLQIKKIVVL